MLLRVQHCTAWHLLRLRTVASKPAIVLRRRNTGPNKLQKVCHTLCPGKEKNKQTKQCYSYDVNTEPVLTYLLSCGFFILTCLLLKYFIYPFLKSTKIKGVQLIHSFLLIKRKKCLLVLPQAELRQASIWTATNFTA